MTLTAVQLDHISLGTILIFGGAVLLWIGLAWFIAPPIGRFLKGDFSDEHPGRERVGLDEPSEFEHWRGERDAARRRAEFRHVTRHGRVS